MSELLIITYPKNKKSYVVRSIKSDDKLMVGNISINAEIVSICDNFETAKLVVRNLK